MPWLYWLLLAVALCGTVAKAASVAAPVWQSGLASSLWLTIATTVLVFAACAFILPPLRRLTLMVCAYLMAVGLLAIVLPTETASARIDSWLVAHIAFSVVAYALFTLGAIAALAVFVKERAIKRKSTSGFAAALPAVTEAERLQSVLLKAAAAVLLLGIVTGMAELYLSRGTLLVLNHKILLSLVAFAVVVTLLAIQHRTGMRGRRLAQFMLVAFLLVTLAYPGVKFVTGVLMA